MSSIYYAGLQRDEKDPGRKRPTLVWAVCRRYFSRSHIAIVSRTDALGVRRKVAQIYRVRSLYLLRVRRCSISFVFTTDLRVLRRRSTRISLDYTSSLSTANDLRLLSPGRLPKKKSLYLLPRTGTHIHLSYLLVGGGE